MNKVYAVEDDGLQPMNTDNLEELAVYRIQSLPKGSGFDAYANIVHAVQGVHAAEHRAARARAKALEMLTK